MTNEFSAARQDQRRGSTAMPSASGGLQRNVSAEANSSAVLSVALSSCMLTRKRSGSLAFAQLVQSLQPTAIHQTRGARPIARPIAA